MINDIIKNLHNDFARIKILLNTYGFIITQNNHKLFEYINERKQ
jgi:hypothetical protein